MLATVLAFLALRLAWVGHPLIWDEAANVLTVRSMAAGGRDFFAASFWKHGPIYPLMLRLAAPLRPGFAERAELVTVAIGVLNLAILFRLNRRVFGPTAAVLSLLVLAAMPGAILMDVWVKWDPLVVTFGLLAIDLFLRGAPVLAGAALGLAGLVKGTAGFYALALVALWATGAGAAGRPRSWRRLAAVVAAAALVSLWWYLGFASSLDYYRRFVVGDRSTSVLVWAEPATFYFTRMLHDLGPAGLALAFAGSVMLAVEAKGARPAAPDRLWPLALLPPTYAVLFAARGKAVWLAFVVHPAWATLEAIALDRMVRLAVAPRPRRSRALAAGALLLIVPALCWRPLRMRDYESVLRAEVPRQAIGALASREVALALNRRVPPGERVVVTRLYYWEGSPLDGLPDPVLLYYVDPRVVLVPRPDATTADAIAAAIQKAGARFALVSVEPSPGGARLLNALIQRGLRPEIHTAGILFQVQTAESSTGDKK